MTALAGALYCQYQMFISPDTGERHFGIAADGFCRDRRRPLCVARADGRRHHHHPARRKSCASASAPRPSAGTIWSTACCSCVFIIFLPKGILGSLAERFQAATTPQAGDTGTRRAHSGAEVKAARSVSRLHKTARWPFQQRGTLHVRGSVGILPRKAATDFVAAEQRQRSERGVCWFVTSSPRHLPLIGRIRTGVIKIRVAARNSSIHQHDDPGRAAAAAVLHFDRDGIEAVFQVSHGRRRPLSNHSDTSFPRKFRTKSNASILRRMRKTGTPDKPYPAASRLGDKALIELGVYAFSGA